MRQPLISEKNSLWQNGLGCVATAFILPLAIVLKLVTMPFERPRKLDAEDVTSLLRRCLDDTATDGEIDYFISTEIADPNLNEIKDEVGSLYGPGWNDPVARRKLEALLGRAEALAARSQA